VPPLFRTPAGSSVDAQRGRIENAGRRESVGTRRWRHALLASDRQYREIVSERRSVDVPWQSRPDRRVSRHATVSRSSARRARTPGRRRPSSACWPPIPMRLCLKISRCIGCQVVPGEQRGAASRSSNPLRGIDPCGHRETDDGKVCNLRPPSCRCLLSISWSSRSRRRRAR